MDKQIRKYEISLPDNENPIIFETGWKAKQANGSIWISQGGTVVLVTAVAGKAPESYQDFFPLTVNYTEKMYSIGKIPGGYVKRETKPTDKETLTSRLIDRPLRPLFADGFRNETQVVATVLSADGVCLPDILALNAASAALMISDIPFNIAVGGVRVGKLNGNLVVNPPLAAFGDLTMNIVVAGTKDAIAMVEAGMNGATEEEVVEALEFAHDQIKKLVEIQEKMAAEIGKPKMEYADFSLPKDLVKEASDKFAGAFREAFSMQGKLELYSAIDKVKKDYMTFAEEKIGSDKFASQKGMYKDIAGEVEKFVFRDTLVKTHKRVDGRRLDEIRPIDIECGVLPKAHGSAIFTRGETQALVVVTLGSKMDSQMIESIEGNMNKTFMLQYNFPPYSVGEVGRMGAPGRREIGHGALAERSLSTIIPSGEDFPYTIRIVSDILESNGSSSMASVCGGTLAMMDAGLQIKAPVAGIAMGLVMQDDGQYAVLTDIMGLEDHLGDMDFKVSGTSSGITALQMDIKIKGLSKEVLTKALSQAKDGRLFILGKIAEALPEPRKELAPNAPRVFAMKINPEKTGALIGPQGKNVKAIVEATGATVDILDGGVVNIFGKDKETIEAAINMIEASVAEAVEGKTYKATVKKVMEYGAFVEILPGLEGLLHVSQYSHERIQNIADYVKIGDKIDVQYMGKDRNGRMDLSRKALLPKPERQEKTENSEEN